MREGIAPSPAFATTGASHPCPPTILAPLPSHLLLLPGEEEEGVWLTSPLKSALSTRLVVTLLALNGVLFVLPRIRRPRVGEEDFSLLLWRWGRRRSLSSRARRVVCTPRAAGMLLGSKSSCRSELSLLHHHLSEGLSEDWIPAFNPC
jgi:hypothetical protein